jgi:hypothetical protein
MGDDAPDPLDDDAHDAYPGVKSATPKRHSPVARRPRAFILFVTDLIQSHCNSVDRAQMR